MSRTNKHRVNHINSLSMLFMKHKLGPWSKCPRRSCGGTMVQVFSRYKDHGPVYEEQECATCGKVIKNPQYKIDRERERQERNRKRWKNKRRPDTNRRQGGNRNASNRRPTRS